MTPFRCAKEIAEFLKSKLQLGETGRIYEGFLPKIDKVKDAYKRCPAIAVRATEIEDGKDASTVNISIYVVTYDDDMEFGSESLYHLVEAIRFELLSNNPVNNRWLINLKEDNLWIMIPDEQPYPYWWSTIEFTVNIPQPSNDIVINQFTR